MAKRREIPLLKGRASDPGRQREKNEDAEGFKQIGDRELSVVADGMGGEVGGQHASSGAVQAALAYFEAHPGLVPTDLLSQAVQAANHRILARQQANPELRDMGTTLELVLVEGGSKAWWAHVGDSRIWHVSAGRARQVTTDHTVIQQMLDGGLINADEAREHPRRHILSRVVGRDPSPKPDVATEPIILGEGDAIVMASDGLADLVSADEIATVISACGPQFGCDKLVKLANDRGGHDNITVRAMYYGRESRSWAKAPGVATLLAASRRSDTARRRPPRVRHVISVLAACVVVAIVAGIYVLHLLGAKPSIPQSPSPRGARTSAPPHDRTDKPRSAAPGIPSPTVVSDSEAMDSSAPAQPIPDRPPSTGKLGSKWTVVVDAKQETWRFDDSNDTVTTTDESVVFRVFTSGSDVWVVDSTDTPWFTGRLAPDRKSIDGWNDSARKWHVDIKR